MRKIAESITFVVLLVALFSLSNYSQNGKKPSSEPQKDINITVTSTEYVFPPPTGFLNDFSQVLNKNDKQEIENVLRQLQKTAKIDFAVAVIDSTKEKPIFDYSLAMARAWKLGSENGGILLLVAIKDRKWQIQIDRKLEQSLSNEEVKPIGDLLKADFQQGNYTAGLKKCIEKMIAVLAEKQHFKPFKFKAKN